MRFSRYNFLCQKEGEYYGIYNVLNTNFVKINKEEEMFHFEKLVKSGILPNNDEMVQALYKSGYVVEDDFDEYAYAKSKIDAMDKKRNQALFLTILTTLQCNFRCIYCPQEHIEKHLSDEKWNSIYKYIKNAIEKNEKKEIHVDFFGGEPLLRADKILSFIKKVKEFEGLYNVTLLFSCTTNGYLLTPTLYDKIVELGVPFLFQITLDGFAESHNKTRPRVDGAGTWNKIVENLKYINSKEDKNIIILRTNVGPENKDKLDGFYEWVAKTFNSPKFSFAMEKVAKFSNRVKDDMLCNATGDEYSDIYLKAVDDSGITEGREFRILGAVCAHSIKDSFIFAPNGNIFICDNTDVNDSNNKLSIGYLNDNGDIVFTQDISTLYNYEIEKCKTCRVYPICAGRLCPKDKMLLPNERPDCVFKGKMLEDSINFQIASGLLGRLQEKNILKKK